MSERLCTHSFIQDSKKVDETIRALQSEIKSFHDAGCFLQAVLTGINDAIRALLVTPGDDFWNSLERTTQ